MDNVNVIKNMIIIDIDTDIELLTKLLNNGFVPK